MRLLVDENLSLRVASHLAHAAHDVAHVTEVGLGNTDDETILAWAVDQDRAVVSSDADFGTSFAMRGAASPSVVLLRSSDDLKPESADGVLLSVLDRIAELSAGAVASESPGRIRIRRLPFGET